MDFPKAIVINIGPKTGQDASVPNHMVVDIVLIDETNGALSPLLYQLKGSANASGIPNKILSLHEGDLFSALGQVIYIDKERKVVTLRNRNTVAYKHLIVASGSKTGGYPVSQSDFTNGLNALIDAIRLRETILEKTSKREKASPRLPSHDTHFPKLGVKETVSSQSVERVVFPMMHQPNPWHTSISDLNAIEKPLFIVSLDSA